MAKKKKAIPERSLEKEIKYDKYMEALQLGANQIVASLYADGVITIEQVHQTLKD